jgi:hypothetical protein
MATSRKHAGNEADLPHSLIPLTLAVTVVRHKVYGERQIATQGPVGDLDMVANFVAGAVPLYEYFDDPSTPPRALKEATLEGGIFRDGGKELRFLDGRPAKRLLAINAADVECVTALLKERAIPRVP